MTEDRESMADTKETLLHVAKTLDIPAHRRAVELAAASIGKSVGEAESFQARVDPWMQACFGPEISSDRVERNHRFLEESLELVQSLGCSRDEALQLVDYVFDRPLGNPSQEVGGVRVTLAALCLAAGLDEDECAETELAQIWTKVERIREKQKTKPKNSPLPQVTNDGWIFRSPMHGEQDYCGQVWTVDHLGEIELLSIEDAQAEFKTGEVGEIVAFKPTGLNRPGVPASLGQR